MCIYDWLRRPPCPESLRAHSTLYVRFWYRCVCAFLSLAIFFIPWHFEYNRTQQRTRKKNPYFFSPFIYSISNTFSDFNTSIALAAFVNEFFTSYALFRINVSCFFFVFALSTLCLSFLLYSGLNFISSCIRAVKQHTYTKIQHCRSIPGILMHAYTHMHSHTHGFHMFGLKRDDERTLFLCHMQWSHSISSIFCPCYLFNRKTQINKWQKLNSEKSTFLHLYTHWTLRASPLQLTGSTRALIICVRVCVHCNTLQNIDTSRAL